MTESTQARILIVDDNCDAAITLAQLLTTTGFRTATAFDGASALSVAAWFRPTACVLDINMPGMDGYVLARRLRELLTDAPLLLVAVTAHSDIQHLDRATDAGFDLHFTKPADPAEIVRELRRHARGAELGMAVGV